MPGGSRVGCDGAEETGGEGRVDAFEELQEDEADRISLGGKLIAAGVGAAFRQGLWRGVWRGRIESEARRVLLGGAAERCNDVRIDFGGAEGIGGRDVGEADESVHQGQLSRVVELEARNAFAGRR